MEVRDTIKTRKSIRAFRSDPVDAVMLRSLIESAIWAPSWGNSQPWEFAILGGSILSELKDRIEASYLSGLEVQPDIPFPASDSFSPSMAERRRANGKFLYEKLGIGREDKEHRQEFMLSMHRFFEAPNAIIQLLDAPLGPWALVESGLALQNIMLTAHSLGLGTCLEAAVVSYPNEIRAILGIPDSKKIVCGLAVGFPLNGHLAAEFKSDREIVEKFFTLYGVDA